MKNALLLGSCIFGLAVAPALTPFVMGGLFVGGQVANQVSQNLDQDCNAAKRELEMARNLNLSNQEELIQKSTKACYNIN